MCSNGTVKFRFRSFENISPAKQRGKNDQDLWVGQTRSRKLYLLTCEPRCVRGHKMFFHLLY